ncbi:hypothetical protein GGI43DRAFT_343159 [Trichoderma evansii]
MGVGQSTLPFKHRLQQSLRLPLARIKRTTDSGPQQPEKLEITVTKTITQETIPIVRSDNGSCKSPRRRSPSLLTINSAAALTPSGSPAGVALGIPAEHILDENPSEVDVPVSRFSFSNSIGIIGVDASAIPSTPSSLTIQGSSSSSIQSPFEVSMMSDLNTNPPAPLMEPIHPSVNQLPNMPLLDLSSEHIVEISRHTSNPNACYLCGFEYRENRELKVHLPCGHSFGISCLYGWILSGLLDTDQVRCPHHCISLRHHCGHLTKPYGSTPYQLHTDVTATTIPSAYEFCRKGEGKRLSNDIKRLQATEVVLVRDAIENRRGRLHKVMDVLRFRRPPFSKKLLSGVRKLRYKAESEMHRRQSFWWINEWVRGGYVPVEALLMLPQEALTDDVIRNQYLQDLH